MAGQVDGGVPFDTPLSAVAAPPSPHLLVQPGVDSCLPYLATAHSHTAALPAAMPWGSPCRDTVPPLPPNQQLHLPPAATRA